MSSQHITFVEAKYIAMLKLEPITSWLTEWFSQLTLLACVYIQIKIYIDIGHTHDVLDYKGIAANTICTIGSFSCFIILDNF